MIQERVKLFMICFCRNKYKKFNDLTSSIYNNRSFAVIGEKRTEHILIDADSGSHVPWGDGGSSLLIAPIFSLK